MTSSAQPLLSGDADTADCVSLQHDGMLLSPILLEKSPSEPRPDRTSGCPRAASIPLASDYTFAGGIPAFVLRPDGLLFSSYAFSRDGKYIAVGDYSQEEGRGTVRISNASTFEELASHQSSSSPILEMVFMDGTDYRMATVDAHGMYRVLAFDASSCSVSCRRTVNLVASTRVNRFLNGVTLEFSMSGSGSVVAIRGYQYLVRPDIGQPLPPRCSDRIDICRISETRCEIASCDFGQDTRVGRFTLSGCGRHLLAMCGDVAGYEGVDCYVANFHVSRMYTDIAYGSENSFTVLHGQTAMFDCDDEVVVAFAQYWDNKHTPFINLCETKYIQRHQRTHDYSNNAIAQKKILLPANSFVLDVLVYRPPSAGPLFECSNLLVWCCVPWSLNQVILVIDTATEFTLSVIKTRVPDTASSLKAWNAGLFGIYGSFCYDGYRKFLERYSIRRMALSGDQKWLLHIDPSCESTREAAVLFSLQQEVPVLKFVLSFDANLSDANFWLFDFDVTGERVIFTSPGGIIMYFPSVLSTSLPSDQLTLMENPALVAQYHDAFRDLACQSSGDLAEQKQPNEEVLKPYVQTLAGLDEEEKSKLLSDVHCGNFKVFAASDESRLVLAFHQLHILMLINKHSGVHSFVWRYDREKFHKGCFAKTLNGFECFVAFVGDSDSSVVVWLNLDSFVQVDIYDLGQVQFTGSKFSSNRGSLLLWTPKAVDIINLADKTVERVEYLTQLPVEGLNRSPDLLSDDGKRCVLGWTKNTNEMAVIETTTTREERKKLEELIGEHPARIDLNWISNDWRWAFLYRKTEGRGHEIFLRDARNPSRREKTVVWQKGGSERDEVVPVCTDVTHLGIAEVTTQASVSQRTFETKHLALAPWAFDDAVPSFRSLKLRGFVSDAEYMTRVVEKFGWCLVNYKGNKEMSFLHECLRAGNLAVARQLLQTAAEYKVLVDIWWKEGDAEISALERGIRNQSRDTVEMIVGFLLEKAAPPAPSARAFGHCLQELISCYPDIFERLFSKDQLVIPVGTVRVPVKALNATAENAVIRTTDLQADWLVGEDRCAEFWRQVDRKLFAGEESAVTIRAQASFVCIEDAAQVGFRGVLRLLVMLKDVPVKVFRSETVKWIVDYKWERFWRRRCLFYIFHYVLILMSFSCYACLHALSRRGSAAVDHIEAGPLVVCWLLSVPCIQMECRQFLTLRGDAVKLRAVSRKSVNGYFCLWNIIDLVAIFNIIGPIPVLHIMSTAKSKRETILYAVIAVEAMLLWFKALYWAQPFRQSGPLVTMILNIVEDMKTFLLISLFVLFGFGVAFYVLFTHEHEDNDEEQSILANAYASSSHGQEEMSGSLPDFDDSFGRLDKSFVTLFFAMLGDFDTEVFKKAERLSWLCLFMFCMYMVAMMIILLNLLIAIMSDTYDRVRMTEDAEMVKCRALVISDCEACLSPVEIRKMESQIGKYLHVIHPVASARKEKDDRGWRGRMVELERIIKAALSRSETENRDKSVHFLESLESQFSRLEQRLDELERKQAQNFGELKDLVANVQQM